jgi:hypothetical protein
MPPPASPEVDSETLAAMVETLELNALRLAGAPWLDIGELPRVRKVVERVSYGRVAVRVDALEASFGSVATAASGSGWGDVYVFAWGRRGAR